MATTSSRREYCSSCGRPWIPNPRLTCDRCREYRRRHHERQRQLQRAQLESQFENEEHVHLPNATPANPNDVSPSPVLPDNDIRESTDLLDRDFQRRNDAWANFPPDVTPSDIRRSILNFRKITSGDTPTCVCAVCGMFASSSEKVSVPENCELLQRLDGRLDSCGLVDGMCNLCSSCYAVLGKGKIPRFSPNNMVNIHFCSDYPDVLRDLTIVEESLIALSHPILVIMKLRPGPALAGASYQALRGHAIVVPQDPSPLFDILPSPSLRLQEHIRVFWFGKDPPDQASLKPYLRVRRAVVQRALEYLVATNDLYKRMRVRINHVALSEWDDEFVPQSLVDAVIHVPESDSHEREGYTMDLQDGNYENDFQAAVDLAADTTTTVADDNHVTPLTSSVLTDVNNKRADVQRLIIDRLSAFLFQDGNPSESTLDPDTDDTSHNGHEPETSPDGNPSLHETDSPSFASQRTAILYRHLGRLKPLNHWEDPTFFTAAFPTLFPSGFGGHLEKREVNVSLPAFARWCLLHHSRRFARHPVFMFLIYDVLRLRAAAVGNSLLVKRRHWQSMDNDFRALRLERLEEAAWVAAEGGRIEDPVISRLQKHIVQIGFHVPGSFSERLRFRSQIRGMFVRYGMPWIWMTINPTDLRDPLILKLAGEDISASLSASDISRFRQKVALSNPVAVAQFFDRICRGVLDGLLQTSTGHIGVLGDVSNYYGVVESNGRGMLHLHCLVWLAGNISLDELRKRTLDDPDFAARIIRFTERIISHSMEVDDSDTSPHSESALYPNAEESDESFERRLVADASKVAAKVQRHSEKHMATCYKYSTKKSGRCRFGFPRALRECSEIDEHGTVRLRRNNKWINSWNWAITNCLRSNHDITLIATSTKSLCLLYYITNYSTKDDVSPSHCLASAALVKSEIIKSAQEQSSCSANDAPNDAYKKSTLRCFNALSRDRDVSAVQVAATLLSLPRSYTKGENFTTVNLWSLRRRVRLICPELREDSTHARNEIDDEPCAYQPRSQVPANIFDNYRRRGRSLRHLCLYDYATLVRVSKKEKKARYVPFEPGHPLHETHSQIIACDESQLQTVTLSGSITENQLAEDRVPGGNPLTVCAENEICEILLGLFVPWEQLEDEYNSYLAGPPAHPSYRDLWLRLRPSLNDRIKFQSDNVFLLRKSRLEAQIDAKQRKEESGSSEDFLDDFDFGLIDDVHPDDEADGAILCHSVDDSPESLISSYRIVYDKWQNSVPESLRSLQSAAFNDAVIMSGFSSFSTTTASSYGLWHRSQETLQAWQDHIKSLSKAPPGAQETLSGTTNHPDDDSPSATDFGDGTVYPVVSDLPPGGYDEDRVTLPDSIDRTDVPAILNFIRSHVPLNAKQQSVVRRSLHHILCSETTAIGDQGLIYVGGEGGVGKSQIVKAIRFVMRALKREHELILMAPTGAAADNIKGNTYHTCLGIRPKSNSESGIGKKNNKRLDLIWRNKTVMILDEVSMVDMASLHDIHYAIQNIRRISPSSAQLFGGLRLVLFMGDFFQFPPVHGLPLWKSPAPDNEAQKEGWALWRKFKDVIILDEQMRQENDPGFRDMLRRARSGTLTDRDVEALSHKVVSDLSQVSFEESTTVVRSNNLRHHVNRLRLENFARRRNQKIIVFPAHHSRTMSKEPSANHLRMEQLLETPDNCSKCPSAGLFFYTTGMPVMLLANICSTIGHVNGAMGTAQGFILQPEAKLFDIGNGYVMCSKPPACVLFSSNSSSPNDLAFTDLGQGLSPVFPLKSTLKIGNYSVHRTQVPLTPAFAVTDYKVQGRTFTTAILDLKEPSQSKRSRHQRFCSLYVQLSRLRSFDGLHLMEPIQSSDIFLKPDELLMEEMNRLEQLQADTLARWSEQYELPEV